MTILYIKMSAKATFDPHTLSGVHASRVDLIHDLPDGGKCGTVRAYSHEARQLLSADPEITILPPLHRPIKKEHADAFSHVGAKVGDDALSVVEALQAHHKAFWFNPEAENI